MGRFDANFHLIRITRCQSLRFNSCIRRLVAACATLPAREFCLRGCNVNERSSSIPDDASAWIGKALERVRRSAEDLTDGEAGLSAELAPLRFALRRSNGTFEENERLSRVCKVGGPPSFRESNQRLWEYVYWSPFRAPQKLARGVETNGNGPYAGRLLHPGKQVGAGDERFHLAEARLDSSMINDKAIELAPSHEAPTNRCQLLTSFELIAKRLACLPHEQEETAGSHELKVSFTTEIRLRNELLGVAVDSGDRRQNGAQVETS
uniref:Uncharacterized protein n=1 Tax=Trichuris muris TaxID=70415 RepID=A0A5S6QEC5_TRIMR